MSYPAADKPLNVVHTMGPIGTMTHPIAFTTTGSCKVIENCVESGDYSNGHYEDGEDCVIHPTREGHLTTNCDLFHTERGYDQLRIGHSVYDGHRDQHHEGGATEKFVCPEGVHVTPATKMVWKSDYSVTKPGWKICLDDTRPTQNPWHRQQPQ